MSPSFFRPSGFLLPPAKRTGRGWGFFSLMAVFQFPARARSIACSGHAQRKRVASRASFVGIARGAALIARLDGVEKQNFQILENSKPVFLPQNQGFSTFRKMEH